METRRFFGCMVRQRIAADCPRVFVFYCSARDAKSWAGVRRAEKLKDGTQRNFRKARLRAIKKFLESNQINTIPNNILLAFGDGTTQFQSVNEQLMGAGFDDAIYNQFPGRIEWGFLSFEFDETFTEEQEHLKVALIIDGQHRVSGIKECNEDMPVLMVAIVNASLTEQAFQFIVINNKVVKVLTNNVKGIIADITQIEAQLNPRLMDAGVPFGKHSPELLQIDTLDDSPFRKILDWTANETENKIVPLTAIEQILISYKRTFPKLDDDDDSLYQFLFAIWNAVKSKYPELWGIKGSILMKKVSLNALNELFIERLKFFSEFDMINIFDQEQVNGKIREIISKIPAEFWTLPWSIDIQDNSNVRDLIKRDLETVMDNSKAPDAQWFENLKLIKPTDTLLGE